jgi:hypothetical protein
MMKREELETILKNHKLWLNHEGGERANPRNADLRNADLDYSCLPLWCGSRGMVVDRKMAAQIAAHFCALSCDDPDFQKAREAVLPFAQTSHRAEELGIKERE